MIKNPITLAVAALAVLTTIAMTGMSPVSAGSYSAASGYLPAQIENRGTAVESVPADTFGDTGLAKTFPKEVFVSLEDEAVKMYY